MTPRPQCTKVSAGMDRKVLIYSAMERSDDMPVGDKDDDEESRLVIQCWDMVSLRFPWRYNGGDKTHMARHGGRTPI